MRWGWLRWPGETRLYYAACLILIIVAAGLRFHDLPSNSLDHDEAVAANNTRGTLDEVLPNTRASNSSPILWPLGLWAIQKIESSHISLRIVPAVASTLTVAALVLLLPRAGLRRSSAFLAGVLMAVSTAAIHEAQDVREYSIDVLLATIMLVGALLYIDGKKKWMLLICLFIAPLLQYGLALFGAAVLVMIVTRKWLDRREDGQPLTSLLSFSILPILVLASGSILTWAITLRYHGTGWASGGYLEHYYYQGDLADVPAVASFVYQQLRDLVDYHVETIPTAMIIVVIVVAVILSKDFRFSGILILALSATAVAAVAALAGLYPLGGTRHSLIWGPIIIIAFAHAASLATERIVQGIPRSTRYSPVIHQAIFIAMPLAICTIGFSDIKKYQDVYADPEAILPVLEVLNDQREDGDIVVWSRRAESALIYYEGTIPDWSRFCTAEESCLRILRELPNDVNRIWLAPYGYPYGNGMYGYHLLSHIFDQNLIHHKIDDSVSLFLVTDARMAAQYFMVFEKNQGEILENPGDIALRTDRYEVYLEKRTILYVSSENCGDIAENDYVVLQIFPVDQSDLSGSAAETGYENLEFRFQSFRVVFGEKCFAVMFLPEYPIDRIWTGARGGDLRYIDLRASLRPVDIDEEFIDRLAPPVLEHDGWLVYSEGSHLVYVGGCGSDQQTPPFFLHLYPADAAELPVGAREHGFENRDFSFSNVSGALGDACVAVRELGDYLIDYIHTGQYDETGKIWEAMIEGEALRSSSE